MPTYEITAPDGSVYEVDGQGSEQEALQHLQQQLGGGASPAPPQAVPEVAEAEQYMRGRGKELQRQQDVAQYAARPPLMRAVQDVSDIFNVAGRSAAGLATGAAGLVSKGLAPLTGVSAAPISPEDVIARLRTGKAEGPEFAAEVEKQNRINEAARNRLGWAAPVAETLPMVALPAAKVFGAGRPLLNLAATSAGLGAAMAAGNKENPLLGAAGGAVGGAAGYGTGKLLGAAAEKGLGLLGKALPVGPLKVPAKAPQITPDDFKSLASAAFDEAESHGVVFNKQGLNHLKNRIVKELTDKGYHPKIQPNIAAVLETIDDYIATGNATQRGMQTLREIASGAYDPMNKKNNMFVDKIINEIDDLSDALNPRHMAAASGDPKAAAEAARYARLMYHKGAKLQLTQDLVESGTLQGETNISKNIRQAVRKKLKTVVDPLQKKTGRGFTALEKEGFRTTIKTTAAQNIAHGLSGLMPRDKLSTSISLLPLAAGVMTGNPLHAALAIPTTLARMGIGAAAEKWANRMAQKSVDDLVHLISTGQTSRQAAQSVLQKLTAAKRQAVMQGLGRIGFGLGAVAAQPLNEAYRQNE